MPAAPIAAAEAVFRELGLAPSALEAGAEVAQLVAQITEEPDIAVAAWIVQARAAGLSINAATAAARFGAAAEALARQLELLGDIGLPPDWTAGRGLTAQQAETLRKMLLAIAADPRLIVARLAMELGRLRHARGLPEAERTRLALEAREIYAPLANRLGVWTLKWELEDLAFRQLEPADYHRIAAALAERRVAREQYIEQACALLRTELAAAGVRAQVYGRPKHIYSIWRKMQRKHLAFEQLYDVRAVRIVVDSVADCYAALGIVHGRWRMLPGEFDDYIATPKDNQYRSIHTAVLGPEGKSLEIQIRTRDMHEHAELGVAAHWRYKEGGARDAHYERKIEWARQMLNPVEAPGGGGDFIDRVRNELFSDRLYALTPRGEVIDLPRGATPLDFAYHVHTQLGHSCRGARVNGRIAPLDQPLSNGEVVEIITGRTGGPSRDWLNADSGFLASPRSRAKVRAWFHQQDLAAQAAAAPPVPTPPPPPLAPAPPPRRGSARASSVVDIEGVGDMPTTMARCCAPVPPEKIAGYLTIGRGVTVHRAGCRSLARMAARNPERLLHVDWNRSAELQLPVQIRIEAYDRRGLLRDVSDVMAQERLSIEGVNSSTDPADRVATIVMRTAVRDTAQLRQVLKKLAGVNSVLRAQRVNA
ncbi:MAG TPA: TGS domain-containing protein [Steroidobacteraceae bacterium]|nr:TGS domain-containing protein [Steroidobacteraceae bacterium]